MSIQTSKVEQERNRASIAKALVELAEDHDVELADALEELVLQEKREEANRINNAGVHRQVQYILESYGPTQVREAKERVEQAIKDDPCVNGLVECCVCREMEFNERTSECGQGVACEKCADKK